MDVGKTSLQKKYAYPERDLSKYEKIKTQGTDTTTSYISLFDESVTKIKLWDTAG
jgi:GTPase SAR1 family protein